MHAGQRVRRDHVAQHLDRIMMDHANMGELLGVDAFQQCAYARAEHFDAEEVDVGTACGDGRRRLAHAEADLEHRRCGPPEDLREVERLGRKWDAVARQQFVECAPLSLCHVTTPQREAADMCGAEDPPTPPQRPVRQRRERVLTRRAWTARSRPRLGDDGEPL